MKTKINYKKILGAIILSLPFLAMAIFGIINVGFLQVCLVFSSVALLVGVVFLGLYLLMI